MSAPSSQRRARSLRAALPVLLLGALVAVGCSRCGGKAGHGTVPSATLELARAMPRAAEAIVVIPELGLLGEKLASLQSLKIFNVLAQTQGAGSAEEYVTALTGQLGVDVRSREALKKAGLDPARGAAVALLPGGAAYLVAAVDDPSAFGDTVARLARDRLGAGEVRSAKEGDVRRTEYARAAGGAPEVTLLLRGKLAWLASGPSAANLAGWSALSAADSLETDPAFTEALGRLPKERELIAYLPSGSSLVQGRHLGGTTLTGHLAVDSLVLRADLAGAGLAPLEAKAGAADLGRWLPADAFAVARYGGDPATLGMVWPHLLGEAATRQIRDSGFDVENALLTNLEPGPLVSVSLSPAVKLGSGVPALDVHRTNPFRFVQLVSVAKVKDVARASAMLESLPALGTKLGAAIVPADRGGQRVFLSHYAQGEGAHLALAGQVLMLAAPEQRLLDTLGRASAQAPQGVAADPVSQAFLRDHTFALVLDLHRLGDAVRGLPSEAWGLGGFAIKATALRWLDATDDLLALEAGLTGVKGVGQAELVLRLQPH